MLCHYPPFYTNDIEYRQADRQINRNELNQKGGGKLDQNHYDARQDGLMRKEVKTDSHIRTTRIYALNKIYSACKKLKPFRYF